MTITPKKGPSCLIGDLNFRKLPLKKQHPSGPHHRRSDIYTVKRCRCAPSHPRQVAVCWLAHGKGVRAPPTWQGGAGGSLRQPPAATPPPPPPHHCNNTHSPECPTPGPSSPADRKRTAIQSSSDRHPCRTIKSFVWERTIIENLSARECACASRCRSVAATGPPPGTN